MTRTDLRHCGKIPHAREELNRSVREGRIESRHCIKSLEGMGTSSHDFFHSSLHSFFYFFFSLHSFTVNCGTISNVDKVAVEHISLRIDLRHDSRSRQCSVRVGIQCLSL